MRHSSSVAQRRQSDTERQTEDWRIVGRLARLWKGLNKQRDPRDVPFDLESELVWLHALFTLAFNLQDVVKIFSFLALPVHRRHLLAHGGKCSSSYTHTHTHTHTYSKTAGVDSSAL
ncbi:hypothetical protein RRG08_049288 [Elysia crispata]|uniref:Uncharacterized protein n=1 Tax=Elysia crispata TaxID=231223 RepID=A0AAE1B234_9GAST|nr:hypothetical protein RRG08_049288 [Elysia crispata]